MSDGREERQQQEVLLEKLKRQIPADLVDAEDLDEWEPEREDS
jgi:hypothetical protein